MKKTYLIALILTTILSLFISGCNIHNTKTNNNNPNTETTNIGNNKGITLYIDKNCENAGIQQCNPTIWEKQFTQILGTGNKVNIEYLNEKNSKTIKEKIGVSPVLVIPEGKLSIFGSQAKSIKEQAKNINGNYYIPLYSWIPGEENLCNDGKDNNNDGKIDEKDPSCFSMTILSSSKCKEQYCNKNILKNMFMGYHLNFVDYNTPEGKALYAKLATGQKLPTFLFNEEKKYMENMKQFIKDVNIDGYKKQLNIPGFKYEPMIEACEKDCNASSICKQKLLSCNKTDKPEVDLYVMSYCPFGTQAEKGIIPVVNLLKDKINFHIKFVDYAMHGKKEIDENTQQYCIEKYQNDKYISYLTCFLEKGDNKDCLKKANIDTNNLNKCIEDTDKKYNITGLFNDKSTWLNGYYPQYPVYKDENVKYGVKGSPTFVINGIKVDVYPRSPQKYLETICKAFKNPPAECNKELSDKQYDPMWGWTQNGKAAPAGSCGK